MHTALALPAAPPSLPTAPPSPLDLARRASTEAAPCDDYVCALCGDRSFVASDCARCGTLLLRENAALPWRPRATAVPVANAALSYWLGCGAVAAVLGTVGRELLRSTPEAATPLVLASVVVAVLSLAGLPWSLRANARATRELARRARAVLRAQGAAVPLERAAEAAPHAHWVRLRGRVHVEVGAGLRRENDVAAFEGARVSSEFTEVAPLLDPDHGVRMPGAEAELRWLVRLRPRAVANGGIFVLDDGSGGLVRVFAANARIASEPAGGEAGDATECAVIEDGALVELVGYLDEVPQGAGAPRAGALLRTLRSDDANPVVLRALEATS